jgi:hypothetical protein
MNYFFKENTMKAWTKLVSAGMFATAALATGAAQANDVSWTVTIGSPRPAPRVIYAPPPVVYQPPAVVYQPVYLPAPVVYSAAPVYRMPPGYAKHWKKHGYKYGDYPAYRYGRHHDRDDD